MDFYYPVLIYRHFSDTIHKGTTQRAGDMVIFLPLILLFSLSLSVSSTYMLACAKTLAAMYFCDSIDNGLANVNGYLTCFHNFSSLILPFEHLNNGLLFSIVNQSDVDNSLKEKKLNRARANMLCDAI